MNELDHFRARLDRIRARGGSTVTLSLREAEMLLEGMQRTVESAPPDQGVIEIELQGEPF